MKKHARVLWLVLGILVVLILALGLGLNKENIEDAQTSNVQPTPTYDTKPFYTFLQADNSVDEWRKPIMTWLGIEFPLQPEEFGYRGNYNEVFAQNVKSIEGKLPKHFFLKEPARNCTKDLPCEERFRLYIINNGGDSFWEIYHQNFGD